MEWKRAKKVGISIFYEAAPHLIACTILSLFNPKQAGIIFVIGLILPDFLVFFSKLTKHPAKRVNGIKVWKYPYFRYYKIKNMIKVFHVLSFLVAVVALFLGYPFVFFAGLSHVLLDLIGF